MYEIYTDNDMLLHSDVTPFEKYKVHEPKLSMADCAAGSLEFKLPPDNLGYDAVHLMTSEVIVKRDGKELWRGRPISESKDFWNRKAYVIEGELAYLNDSIQLPHQYNVSDTTVRTFLESLISNHNSQVEPKKQFKVGMVTVEDGDAVADDDAIHRYTNYETTLECINEKLVNKLGGHIRVQWRVDISDGVLKRHIDYLKDYLTEASAQEIRFGYNLLDYAQNYDGTKWATEIIPRGKRLDEEQIEGLEAYTTVESAPADGDWHVSGSPVVTNAEAVRNFGHIRAVVDWDGVELPSNLLTKAKQYLQSVQFNKISLEISAVDLHYLNPAIDTFDLLESVHCVSDPHGMNTWFPVTKINIDLDEPSNTTYTLGTDSYLNLTSSVSRSDSTIISYMNDNPTESAILRSAKDNAKGLIEGTIEGGYVGYIYGDANNPERPTALRVGNSPTDAPASGTRKWVWSSGGLGHFYAKQNQTTGQWEWAGPNVAMTMDGAIVADRITTGELRLAGNGSGSWLSVYEGTNRIGYWNASGIYIAKGSIRLGALNTSGVCNGHYVAEINNDGSAYFSNVTISGTVYATAGKIGDWNISNGVMEIQQGASAKLSKFVIGCGEGGNGIAILRGASRRSDQNIDTGGDSEWNEDKKWGYIQISTSGSPDQCVYGIRIFGNGHIVWYDGDGDAIRDRYLGNIPTST